MDPSDLIHRLNEAAKPPRITARTEDPAALYMENLKNIVAIVRDAEAGGFLSREILEHADKLTSKLCYEQCEKDYTEGVGPFAFPSGDENRLRTKTRVPYQGLDMFCRLFVSLVLLLLAAHIADIIDGFSTRELFPTLPILGMIVSKSGNHHGPRLSDPAPTQQSTLVSLRPITSKPYLKHLKNQTRRMSRLFCSLARSFQQRQ